jgi:glycosyltransferase involved in cell wall biosynthesis
MPVKILHIIEPVAGGTRTHLLQILDGLPESEFQQSLLCSIERDRSFMAHVERLRARGVRVEIVPMRREPSLLSDARAFFRIYRHLSRRRYDIVHTHCSKAGALGRLAAFLAGVPRIVHTPHVFPFTQDVARHWKVLYRLIEKLLGAFTDRIIAVSTFQRALALKFGIGKRGSVVVIHNGVAEAPRSAVSTDGWQRVREELGVKANDILVGTAGRLMSQKGHKYLVEAAAMLLDRHPHLRFYIAGSGELEDSLRAMCNQLSWCRERVLLLGEREDVPDVLAATDIFVLPSLWEGMPYALLEAMAAAKPIICSNVCGLDEVIKDGMNGLLVPPADSPALAHAISLLVGNRALRLRLGPAARSTVQERFRAEEKILVLAKLYRDIHRSPLVTQA